MIHDKIDFPTDRDVVGIEVWSDDPEMDSSYYNAPWVLLDIDPSSDDPSLMVRLTTTEARLLAAMLVKASERMDTFQKLGVK